jgi:hypothetical protein
MHCTALHCTALHCTALHCTALHCTALHCRKREAEIEPESQRELRHQMQLHSFVLGVRPIVVLCTYDRCDVM